MGNEEDLAPGRRLGDRLRGLVPWLVCLAAFGAGVIVLDGVQRAIAVGAFAASSIGALLAISQVRRAVHSMRTWMGERENALSTFADDRAAAVARQFQWAVEELVSARAELRKVESLRVQAEAQALVVAERARQDGEDLRAARERLGAVDARELDRMRAKIEEIERAFQEEEHDRRIAERRARAAEQRVADLTRTLRLVADTVSFGSEGIASSAARAARLTLDWTLEYDGTGHTLRLRSTAADERPTRARILDANGRPIVESSAARQRRPAEMLLRIPQSVATAVQSGDWSALQLEVEVDDAWRAALLVDRAEPLVDAEAMQPQSLRIVS